MSETDRRRRRRSRRARDAGLLVAASTVPSTFQRTLTTRSTADQALVSGLTFVLSYAGVASIESAVQAVARLAGDEDGPGRELAADLAAAAAGLVTAAAVPWRHRERLPRATVRTLGQVLAASGAAGAIAGTWAGDEEDDDGVRWSPSLRQAVTTALAFGAREIQRHRRATDDDLDPDHEDVDAPRALALGAAVAGAAVGLSTAQRRASEAITGRLTAVAPEAADVWRPVGHLATLAIIAGTGRVAVQRVFTRIEGVQTGFEAALDVPPPATAVSGSPASHVPFATMSRMGRRFVWTVRPPWEIERVMGEEAQAHPVRVYGGLGLADDSADRVRLVLDDLERAGGLDRSWLVVASPTGTGYVNYAAVGALELLTRGDCATVALQYGARPSPLSLDRVEDGREQFRLLLDALGERLEGRPTRPTVVVFGESLGAWTSQDAFLHTGTDGLAAAGVDHALWIGTPFESEWKDQVLADDRDDVDEDLVAVVHDLAAWQSLPERHRARARYVMLTHDDDGVARFGASLLVRRPEWLGDPEQRPPKVPRSQRWEPLTTFVQTLVDMKNAARVVPGVFEARGHDYRADLPGVIAAVLDLPATAEQQERIMRALEGEEAFRARWIAEHSAVGSSMATNLLERIRSDHPAAFEQAFHELAAESRGWREAFESGDG